jgi:hypothetical protein
MTTLAADVAIYGGARPDDETRVREALRELDVNARVQTATSGTDRSSWVVLASLPTRMLFDNMAARRADVASQVRELVRRITERGDGSVPGLLMLQDTETGIQIVLWKDLPEIAFQSLPQVDLIRFTFGPVHYDVVAAAWRSPFDERPPPR